MKRRRNGMSGWLLLPLMLVGVGIGIAGLLVWQGKLELPWAKKSEPVPVLETSDSREGLIAVPMCPRAIPAYTQVRRDHLWDSQKQAFHYFYMKSDQVPSDVKVKLSDIRGRVLRHPKRQGFVFSEDDFYPKGTRSGLVAAIPPGKRSLRVTTGQIRGLHELNPGDRFDVIVAQKVEAKAQDLQGVEIGGGFNSMLVLQAQMNNAFQTANVNVVVRDGMVIQPVRLRAQPQSINSAMRGATVRTTPVQEVVIALAPGEATRLAQAFATGSDIWCLPRSGRPDDTGEETMDLKVESPLDMVFGDSTEGSGGMAIVERIKGAERVRVAVQRSGAPAAGVASGAKPGNTPEERPAGAVDTGKDSKWR